MVEKATSKPAEAADASKKPKLDEGVETAGSVPAGAKPGEPAKAGKPKEIGGPSGPEPTRYGDWERKGIVSDF